MRINFSLLISIMAIPLALAFFAEGELLELTGFINGRKDPNFYKETKNIMAALPKGTVGKIQKKKQFNSGNWGFQIEVQNGEKKGKSYWVHFNPKTPYLKLSKQEIAPDRPSVDFKRDGMDNLLRPEEAKGALLTSDQVAVRDSNDYAKEIMKQNLENFNRLNKNGNQTLIECEKTDPVITPRRKPSLVVQADLDPKDDEQHRALYAKFQKLGGDPKSLDHALCYLNKNKDKFKIENQRFITINDQNKSSLSNRLYVLDLLKGDVKSYFTAHGNGGNERHTDVQPIFSNSGKSNYMPRGFFVTGEEKYVGKYGDNSLRLYGAQKGVNDNSYGRNIVMHPMSGVPDIELNSKDSDEAPVYLEGQEMSTTEGCTGLPPHLAEEIVGSVKGRSLYYVYSPEEKSKGEDYCGD